MHWYSHWKLMKNMELAICFYLCCFLSIVGVFAFCKLMKLLIIHCYCLQYIVIKYTIFFVVWFKISITHFLNSSQKPFIAFYNVKQKYAFTIMQKVSMCFQTLISNAKENTQLYCQKHNCQKMGVVLALKLARTSCMLKCMAWHSL